MDLKIDSKELDKHLALMEKRNTDKRDFFKEVVIVLAESTANNFRAGGRPTKWKALEASTLIVKRRHHADTGGNDILLWDGQLRTSVNIGGMDNIKEITKDYAEFGTNVKHAPYVQYHKDGSDKRPFLLFQQKDIDKIVARAASHAFGDR